MRSDKRIRKKEIEQKIVEMEDYIRQIDEYLPSDKESFLHSGIEKHGIYKLIESAIENVIKICSMINSDLKLGVPSDEDGIIKNLEKERVISEKLTEKIISLKGFRNIIVHRYGKINDEEAYENINENLGDFDDFKKEILNFIDKQ